MSRIPQGVTEREASNLEEILEGMARALWVTAYASWADEHRDEVEEIARGGQNWNDVAPETPDAAAKAAKDLAALFVEANSEGYRRPITLAVLYTRSLEAMTGMPEMRRVKTDPETFGWYMAMQAMGTGTSWFDDHPRFEVKVPDFEVWFDGEELQWSGGMIHRNPRSPSDLDAKIAEFMATPKLGDPTWEREWSDLLTQKHTKARPPTVDEIGRAFHYIAREYNLGEEGQIDGEMWAEGLAFGTYAPDADDKRQAEAALPQLSVGAWIRLAERANYLLAEDGKPPRYVRPQQNPRGAFTAKGERMYEHVKRSEMDRGSPRAKEIAARTVFARAKAGAHGLLRHRNPTLPPTSDAIEHQRAYLIRDGWENVTVRSGWPETWEQKLGSDWYTLERASNGWHAGFSHRRGDSDSIERGSTFRSVTDAVRWARDHAHVYPSAIPSVPGMLANPSRWPASEVQSLLFDKTVFTEHQAKEWAREHGYHYGKVDTTGSYHRLRQEAPTGGPCRTIEFTQGVKAIVCSSAHGRPPGVPHGR